MRNISRQGTWADGLIIQAVADKLNLKIHITESHPNFAEFTIVEATSPQQQLRTIYIGHADEFHYVSTKQLLPSISHLKHGIVENAADEPQNAKRQCAIKLSLCENSAIDNSN